jgi:uncharacterized membrane protein (DUF485 family)
VSRITPSHPWRLSLAGSRRDVLERMVTLATTQPTRQGGGSTYEEVQSSPEFVELRSRFRRFVFPLTALFLAWYFLYVLLAAYATSFMATPVIGNINVGLIFGLLQFVSTFAITMYYARWADREFDPMAERLREKIEGGHQ